MGTEVPVGAEGPRPRHDVGPNAATFCLDHCSHRCGHGPWTSLITACGLPWGCSKPTRKYCFISRHSALSLAWGTLNSSTLPLSGWTSQSLCSTAQEQPGWVGSPQRTLCLLLCMCVGMWGAHNSSSLGVSSYGWNRGLKILLMPACKRRVKIVSIQASEKETDQLLTFSKGTILILPTVYIKNCTENTWISADGSTRARQAHRPGPGRGGQSPLKWGPLFISYICDVISTVILEKNWGTPLNMLRGCLPNIGRLNY